MRASRCVRPRTAVVAALVLGALAALGLVRLAGVAWWIVESPSMGTAAPVGALVVTAPVPLARLAVGDVVTYRPPTGGMPVTRRVVALVPGAVRRRSDANGAPDPRPVPAHALVGRASAILPGLGWLLRALPSLVAGLTVLHVASAVVRDPAARGAVRVLGCSALVAGCVAVLHPFTAVTTVLAATDAHGTAVRLVSTGLLPVRVSAGGGRHLDLVSGQSGVLRLPADAPRTELVAALDLPPAAWLLFAAICLLPAAAAAGVSRRPRPPRSLPPPHPA